MEQLILLRHAHAVSNAEDVTSCMPPGAGLTEIGRAQAGTLAGVLGADAIALGLSSRMLRARETLELALGGRSVPTLVAAELDEINFGAFDGGAVEDYRRWAWTADAAAPCPGGGESRSALAERMSRALGLLLDRPEATVLAVAHALPVRYVLDAAAGLVPAARMTKVPHAEPFRVGRDEVVRARSLLVNWAEMPLFRE